MVVSIAAEELGRKRDKLRYKNQIHGNVAYCVGIEMEDGSIEFDGLRHITILLTKQEAAAKAYDKTYNKRIFPSKAKLGAQWEPYEIIFKKVEK